MRYLSLFSGIEAATVAWHPLGWECVAVAEIDKFPCALLAHKYPDVPNLGDVSKVTAEDIRALGPIDLVVFGSPCQDLSVAGKRKGLAGARSGLFHVALDIVDWAREHCGARWALWENVLGAFSSQQGRDFATVVEELAGLSDCPVPPKGWGNEGAAIGEKAMVEWSTLDAQWFGVAQRRRRVFALADFGDWTRRSPVLLEPESLRGDSAPSRDPKEGHPTGFECGFGGCNFTEVASTLDCGCKDGPIRSQQGCGVFVPPLPFDRTQITSPQNGSNPKPGDPCHPLTAKGHVPAVSLASAVRRLTPTECERLQGFPDVENCVIIRVCRSEDERQEIARSAAWGSAAQSHAPSAPVAVNVRIDLERSVLQIHSLERLSLSVSNAADESWSVLRMPQGDFVRLAALMTQTLAKITRNGVAASLPNIRGFSQALNGSALVLLCGQEIAALASDAERFTTALEGCTKYITLERGPPSLSCGLTLETLASCVSAVISGFIPPAMKDACSFEIRLTTSQGYTSIPYRGKPAADAPRYKALGNSMAVPVMRWIADRIELALAIEDLT
jgi:DNA (cytosine-5)-methyltransferase 1